MNHENENSQQRISSEIAHLRSNLGVKTTDLFGSNKLQDPEKPNINGVHVDISDPLETMESPSSPIRQELKAVISLGGNIALSVVYAKASDGTEVGYLSVLSGDPSKRAVFFRMINKGEVINIGRDDIAKLMDDPEMAKGVSGNHCSVQVDDETLTVIDQNSTNGTVVFSKEDGAADNPYDSHDVQMWSGSTVAVEMSIKQARHELETIQASMLGSFVVDEAKNGE